MYFIKLMFRDVFWAPWPSRFCSAPKQGHPATTRLPLSAAPHAKLADLHAQSWCKRWAAASCLTPLCTKPVLISDTNKSDYSPHQATGKCVLWLVSAAWRSCSGTTTGTHLPWGANIFMTMISSGSTAGALQRQISASDTNGTPAQWHCNVPFQKFLLLASCPITGCPVAGPWLGSLESAALCCTQVLAQVRLWYSCLSGPLCYKDLRNWNFAFYCWYSLPSLPEFSTSLC